MADAVKILQSVFGPRDFVPDIQVVGEKCAACRHSRAQCRECISACPSGALSYSDKAIEIDHEACTHCGACVAVCPTQAIESAWLPWKKLVADALHAVKVSKGNPTISCSVRSGSEGLLQGESCSIPCLERVDEALILSMVAAGAKRITFSPGDCTACGIGCKPARWPAVIESTQEMLASVGCGVEVAIDFEPADAADVQEPAISRRDVLSGIGESAARVTGDVVEAYVNESRYGEIARMLGLLEEDSQLGNATRGQVCSWALGALALQKAGGARAALDLYGENALPTRLYAKPVVDAAACSRCLLCVAYCREHAIEKFIDGTKVKGLSVKPYLCNGCGTCVDVCRSGTLSLSHQISLADILLERSTDTLFEDADSAK